MVVIVVLSVMVELVEKEVVHGFVLVKKGKLMVVEFWSRGRRRGVGGGCSGGCRPSPPAKGLAKEGHDAAGLEEKEEEEM